jgi:cAMP-dependent protein kinase regulator
MAGPGFNSPFGANTNPFGSSRLDTGVMQRVAEEDENDTITSPTTPHFGHSGGSLFRPPFGGDASSETEQSGLRSPSNPEGYPAQYNFGRRTSVSAESLKPAADSYDNWTPPVHPKTPEQLDRLKKAISVNFLFSHLDDEQTAQVLGALVEKPIPAQGIKVRSNLGIHTQT